MKHTIESLKRNPTLAEIWELEKELKQKMAHLEDWGKNMCNPQEPQYSKVWGQFDLLKEILG